MVSNRVAFLGLGLACVVAAAGGSYLATRHSARLAPPASAASIPEIPVVATAPSQPSGSAPALAQAEPTAPTASPRVPRASLPANQPAKAASRPTGEPRVKAPAPTLATDATSPAAPIENPAPTSVPAEPTPVVPQIEERAVETPRVSELAPPALAEVVVAADSVIGLRPENSLSSERARVEDRVEARVIRDVRVNGRVAIPAGSRVSGSVVVVERGGKVRERARLGIRFHTFDTCRRHAPASQHRDHPALR